MIGRCYSKSYGNYPRYGGRGITVCSEWRNSFERFSEWAAANGYSDELTIDRRENNGAYCPENCRWITKAQQQFNKRPRSGSSTSYKGVHRSRKRFAAKIGTKHLGTFDTPEMAARAYDAAAAKEYGDVAYLNFPRKDVEDVGSVASGQSEYRSRR